MPLSLLPTSLALLQFVFMQSMGRDAAGQTFPIPTASGHAVLRCTATPARRLEHCNVQMEYPVGLRLGYAALRMTEGQPVDGLAYSAGKDGLYSVIIQFGRQDQPAGTLVPFFVLLAAPTINEIRAVVPENVGDPTVVSLLCRVATDGRLRMCDVAPGGSQQSAAFHAALALAPSFRVDMGYYQKTFDNAVKNSTEFDLKNFAAPLAISFSSRVMSPGSPRYIRRVDWLAREGADDSKPTYPPKAKSAGVTSGVATLDCAIVEGGRLNGCTVLSETPADVGFGEAALDQASHMRANLWTRDGEPTVEARVRLPFQFTPDDDASARAARSAKP